jgi:hypothetical protein
VRAAICALMTALVLLCAQAAAALDAVCASMSTSGVLQSDKLPIARLADAPCSDTLDDAVRAALEVAMPLTRRAEFGGLILELEGRYCYTTPVTSYQFHEVRFHAEVPASARIAALFHTHLRHDGARWFSEADIATAVRFGVRSYIGIVDRGEVRVFDPARMQGKRTVLLPQCGAVSRGELVALWAERNQFFRVPATTQGTRRSR